MPRKDHGNGWETWLDEGPLGWDAGNTVTRRDFGYLPLRTIIRIPADGPEDALFERSRYGRYTPQKWAAFRRSVSQKGITNPIQIRVSRLGRVTLYEGNHRRRVAEELGLETVPVEIFYEGNSQRKGLLVDPSRL